jgi:hypothetical protein
MKSLQPTLNDSCKRAVILSLLLQPLRPWCCIVVLMVFLDILVEKLHHTFLFLKERNFPPLNAGTAKCRVYTAEAVLSDKDILIGHIGIFHHIVKHHEGRRTSLPCCTMEMQPGVLRQRAVEPDEPVDFTGLRSHVIRAGKPYVAHAGAGNELLLIQHLFSFYSG